jgi:hypothetical protein
LTSLARIDLKKPEPEYRSLRKILSEVVLEKGPNQFNIKGMGGVQPGGYFLNVVVNGSEKLTVHMVKS